MNHERARCLDELRVLCCAVYPGRVGYFERSRGSECQEMATLSEAIDDAKSMWPCQRRDVDLKITKPENLKRRQKEVCPLMTRTALDQETMETWLDVIPLLEVGRALVSRRCTCLRALRSFYLTTQNICRSRWPCDRRPLYVLERRTNPPSFKHRIWCANPDGSSLHAAWIVYGWQCSQKPAGAHKGIRKSPGYF